MISGKVNVDLKNLSKFSESLKSSDSPVKKGLKQWAAIYRGFAQRRFASLSRGGGEWPPLKHGRKRGTLARAMILRDTGTLFAALDTVWSGKPGALQEDIPFGVRVGFGGPHRHSKSPALIADIARRHQTGDSVPVRKIIVPPDAPTRALMDRVMKRALAQR